MLAIAVFGASLDVLSILRALVRRGSGGVDDPASSVGLVFCDVGFDTCGGKATVAMINIVPYSCLTILTFLLSFDIDLDVGVLEGSPFEVLLVASTFDLTFGTLLATWFLLVTFESFGFTCDAA